MIVVIKNGKVIYYNTVADNAPAGEMIVVPDILQLRLGMVDPRTKMTAEDQLTVQKRTLAINRKIGEDQGVVWNGHRFNSNPESQARLINTLYSLDKALIMEPVFWKTQDGVFVSMTTANLTALAQVMALYIESKFNEEKTALEAL